MMVCDIKQWDNINTWRRKNGVNIRKLAREMRLPYWVLYNALTGITGHMHDYHQARVDDWLGKHNIGGV